MDFGYFNIFSRCEGESSTEACDRNIAETVYAETLGFDSTWLAEAYLLGTVVFGAGSLQSATILAAKTTRIRIGTAVCTMPLHNPLAVAVQSTSIDQLSHGRFDLGIGRGLFVGALGGADNGFEAMGSGTFPEPDVEADRARYLESIECVKGLLQQDSFNYDGDFFKFSDCKIFPRSFQEPHVPVWAVAQSARSFVDMGKMGVNLLIPLPGYHMGMDTWEEMKKMLLEYRQLWKDCGYPHTPKVIVRVPTFLHETREQAWEVARRSIERFQARFPQQAAESGLASIFGDTGGAARIFGTTGVDEGLFTPNASVDDTIETVTITGTPEFAIDEFERVREELDADIMLELQFYGQTEREDVLRTMRLVADRVIPHFK